MEPVAVASDQTTPEGPPPACPPEPWRKRTTARWRALAQIAVCSGVPTQLLLAQALALAGVGPFGDGGALNATWVFAVSLADTVLLVGLIVVFLRANGESVREVLIGQRPGWREVQIGLVSVVPVLLSAAAVLLAARYLAPWLHNVPDNPLAGLLKSPRDAWLFGVVALVAGGLREELQRAFLLTRFEQHLGGARVGLVATSLAFGLAHVLQGFDAMLATALLGFIWGAMYLWRRSTIAPIVSHGGFNSLEIVRYLVIGPGA